MLFVNDKNKKNVNYQLVKVFFFQTELDHVQSRGLGSVDLTANKFWPSYENVW